MQAEPNKKSHTVRTVLFIVIPICLFVGLCVFGISKFIVMYCEFQTKSYTVDGAKSMFNANKEDFDKVAQIILNSDTFWQNEVGTEDATEAQMFCNQYMIGRYKNDFTAQEWTVISNFLKNTQPGEIIRNSNGVIEIWYGAADENVLKFVFYYNVENTAYGLQYYSQMSAHFEKIDENWYVGYGQYAMPPAR